MGISDYYFTDDKLEFYKFLKLALIGLLFITVYFCFACFVFNNDK